MKIVFILILLLNSAPLFSANGNYAVLNKSKMMAVYKKFKNTPYKFGGDSKEGIDCSAFTRRIFSATGINLPRTSRQQFLLGRQVNKYELMFGDLLFFSKNGDRISHVGMYVGNGLFINSASGRGVSKGNLNSYYWWRLYKGAKRIGYTDFISYLRGEFSILPEPYFLGDLPVAYLGNYNKIAAGYDTRFWAEFMLLSYIDVHISDRILFKGEVFKEKNYVPQAAVLTAFYQNKFDDWGIVLSKIVPLKPMRYFRNITKFHFYYNFSGKDYIFGIEQQLFRAFSGGINIMSGEMEYYAYLQPITAIRIGIIRHASRTKYSIALNFGAFHKISKLKGRTSVRFSPP